jgi:hypothetical protein
MRINGSAKKIFNQDDHASLQAKLRERQGPNCFCFPFSPLTREGKIRLAVADVHPFLERSFDPLGTIFYS